MAAKVFTVSGTAVLVAHSNYVGMFGNPEISPDPGFLSPDHRSVESLPIGACSAATLRCRCRDVTDGTSNTIFVGERCSNLAYATWTGSVTGGQVPPDAAQSLRLWAGGGADFDSRSYRRHHGRAAPHAQQPSLPRR